MYLLVDYTIYRFQFGTVKAMLQKHLRKRGYGGMKNHSVKEMRRTFFSSLVPEFIHQINDSSAQAVLAAKDLFG